MKRRNPSPYADIFKAHKSRGGTLSPEAEEALARHEAETIAPEVIEVAPVGLAARPLTEAAFPLTPEQRAEVKREQQKRRLAEEKQAEESRIARERTLRDERWQRLVESGSPAAQAITITEAEPVAAGELSFEQFAAIKLLREIEDQLEGFAIAKKLGMPPPSPEQQQAVADKYEQVHKVLDIFGFDTISKIRKLQSNVYRLLFRNAIIAARRMLRGRKEISAQEVAAEVATHCYRNMHTFRADSKLMTWVWSATRNLILDVLSRNKAKGIVGLGGQGLGLTETTTIDDKIADSLFEQGKLTEKQREFLRGKAVVRAMDENILNNLAVAEADEEEQEQADQILYGVEEDRIIAEAFAKLPQKHRDVLEAYAFRGTVKLADGTEAATGDSPPSRLLMGHILGVPEYQIGKKLYNARQELTSLLEKPVTPPYFGVLAERYYPQVTKVVIGKNGLKVEPSPTKVIRGRPEWARRPMAEEYLPSYQPASMPAFDMEAMVQERNQLMNKQLRARATREDLQRIREIQDQIEQFKSEQNRQRLKAEQAVALSGYETPEVRLSYGGAGAQAIGFYQRDPTRTRRVNPDEREVYFTGALDLGDMFDAGEITKEEYDTLIDYLENEIA